jgi:hypothetical protein
MASGERTSSYFGICRFNSVRSVLGILAVNALFSRQRLCEIAALVANAD